MLGRLSDRHGRVDPDSLSGWRVGRLCPDGVGDRLAILATIVAESGGGGILHGNIAIVQAMAADMSTTKTKTRSFAWINIGMNLGWVLGPMIGVMRPWYREITVWPPGWRWP